MAFWVILDYSVATDEMLSSPSDRTKGQQPSTAEDSTMAGTGNRRPGHNPRGRAETSQR
jgi:hypothetical protein